MFDPDYGQRQRESRILWIVELLSFVAIIVIAAVAYTVTP